jgi:hypothetical protein
MQHNPNSIFEAASQVLSSTPESYEVTLKEEVGDIYDITDKAGKTEVALLLKGDPEKKGTSAKYATITKDGWVKTFTIDTGRRAGDQRKTIATIKLADFELIFKNLKELKAG